MGQDYLLLYIVAAAILVVALIMLDADFTGGDTALAVGQHDRHDGS